MDFYARTIIWSGNKVRQSVCYVNHDNLFLKRCAARNINACARIKKSMCEVRRLDSTVNSLSGENWLKVRLQCNATEQAFKFEITRIPSGENFAVSSAPP